MKHSPISNMISAALSKTIGIVGPFIIRTIIIYKLGNEYVGLNSLFTSLLLVLSMTELGFGAALTYSMYRPVNEGNAIKLSALLNYYKNIYRMIGITILLIGVFITPFIKYLINGEYPNSINIFVLFIIFLVNTVLTYTPFTYKSSILIANRRNDIVNIIQSITQFLMYLFQVLALVVFGNYYAYALLMPFFAIVNNVFINIATKHFYPDIIPNGKLRTIERNSLFGKVKALFIHRLAGVLIVAMDNVFVSAILGLVDLALFTNYFYIVNALNGMIEMIMSSVVSTIGNDLLNETDEENYTRLCMYSYLLCMGVGFLTICLFNMLHPFVSLWVGEKSALPATTEILFCAYFYSWRIRSMGQVYRDAAGMWKKDVLKSWLGIFLDLVLNFVLISTIGINGALISTIVIMVVVFCPWETRIISKELLHCKPGRYIRIIITNILLTGIAMYLSSCILKYVTITNSLIELTARFCLSVVIAFIVLFLPTSRSKEFKKICTLITENRKRINNE